MSETIKDFLVSLGWEFDENKQKRFVDAMRGAEFQAKLLADALEALARKAWQTVSDVAEAFDRLYFSSQRTGATVSTIRDFGYAVRQLGGSAEAAQASLEAMGQKLRENPANIAYLNALGFGINKITGHLEVQRDLLAKFQQMPMAVAEQYRGLAGEDERTFLAMRDPQMLRLMDEAAAFRKRIGFDPDQAATDANKFMSTWRGVAMQLGNIADDLLTKIMAALVGPFQEFQKFIDANGPQIGKDIQLIADALGEMAAGWEKSFEAIIKDPEAMKSFRDTMHELAVDVAGLARSFRNFIDDLKWLNATPSEWLNRLLGPGATNRGFAPGEGPSSPPGTAGAIGPLGGEEAAPALGGDAPSRLNGGSGGGISGWWKRTMPTWLGGSGDKTSEAAPASGGPVPHLASSPSGGLTGRTQAAMAVAMDQLRREGVPEENLRAAAAMLTGNAIAESALVPTTIHDQGTGYGIYGARLERRDRMLAWLSANGYEKNSLEGQMRYMAKEAMSMKGVRGLLMGATPSNLAANDGAFIGAFENPKVIGNRTSQVALAYRTGGAPLAQDDADQSAKIGRFVTDPDGSKRWVRWGVDSSSVPDNGASSPSAASPAKTPSWADVQRDAAEGAAQIKKWEAQKNPWGSLQNYWSTPPALGADGGGGGDNHVTVTQHNTFNVDGANDPSIVAHMVASNQNRTVQDITRNMIGATN